MADQKPPVDEIAELAALLETGTKQASAAVGSGDVTEVFEAGMQMGILVGIGLGTAHSIREAAQRDRNRAPGQGEFYKRHDARAQAFGELANALKQWSERMRRESRESRVPDSA
ncbi:MAG TPA: hypothetical protein VL614_00530 [Acetobacteraceae bacterium]|jgi:hypothetical protein|nr:hypothetical protein [Acetobacteraceae bacterium]